MKPCPVHKGKADIVYAFLNTRAGQNATQYKDRLPSNVRSYIWRRYRAFHQRVFNTSAAGWTQYKKDMMSQIIHARMRGIYVKP